MLFNINILIISYVLIIKKSIATYSTAAIKVVYFEKYVSHMMYGFQGLFFVLF